MDNPEPMPGVRLIERAKQLAEEIANYDDGILAESLIELLALVTDPQGNLAKHDAAGVAMDQAYLHTEGFQDAREHFLSKYQPEPERIN
jgi:hypothetical protein